MVLSGVNRRRRRCRFHSNPWIASPLDTPVPSISFETNAQVCPDEMDSGVDLSAWHALTSLASLETDYRPANATSCFVRPVCFPGSLGVLEAYRVKAALIPKHPALRPQFSLP